MPAGKRFRHFSPQILQSRGFLGGLFSAHQFAQKLFLVSDSEFSFS
jgi:hypothetical protein